MNTRSINPAIRVVISSINRPKGWQRPLQIGLLEGLKGSIGSNFPQPWHSKAFCTSRLLNSSAPQASHSGRDFKILRFTPRETEDAWQNIQQNPLFFRDACDCSQCVDESSRQRNYAFFNIPGHITPTLSHTDDEGNIHVKWTNDVPGFDDTHVSKFSPSFVKERSRPFAVRDKSSSEPRWDAATFAHKGCWTRFEDFMNQEEPLRRLLWHLHMDGLVFVTNVPPEASSVSDIGERIGPLKNTFYGLTWDVKSVPQAKNVAYTSKYLGFHMDLLYVKDPPCLQLLHCITNTCTGGESRFVDTFKAASIYAKRYPHFVDLLSRTNLCYEYDNDGYYYEQARPIFWHRNVPQLGGKSLDESLRWVNWSPEFLDTPAYPNPNRALIAQFREAAKAFADILESEELVYQVKMDPGTCVIFQNRRVAHARNAFDMNSGERWLRGAYLDEDVFRSKLRVLGVEGPQDPKLSSR